ncbi:hypothetical protein [Microbacterium sp.]|uniref:hypothetical protein n=1 Tax=Microbacterium sp. TaxID=51671 RepID=UPI00262B803A|nr:hypothetical protein [Microbacterium sp.]
MSIEHDPEDVRAAGADVRAAADPASGPGFTSWAVVLTLVRAGVVAGLWPVLLGPEGGIETENLLPYLLHLVGALATVVVVAMQHTVMRLVAIAFTGYSTIVLGIGAPGVTGIVIWVTGIAALIAVLAAALRPGGRAGRWAWIAGAALAVAAGVAVTVVGLGL